MTVLDDEVAAAADPIDELVPAPGPWWRNLVTGVLIVLAVGAIAYLWGFGYLMPRPECCGSGSSGAMMSLSPDGEAVTVTAYFFNSSGRDLSIESAGAELPGAEVLDVSMLAADNSVYPTDNVAAYPALVPGPGSRSLLITFVPETCVDRSGPWGTVTMELAVANEIWPSIGRTFRIDVVDAPQDLVLLPPAWVVKLPQTPLAGACALLGR